MLLPRFTASPSSLWAAILWGFLTQNPPNCCASQLATCYRLKLGDMLSPSSVSKDSPDLSTFRVCLDESRIELGWRTCTEIGSFTPPHCSLTTPAIKLDRQLPSHQRQTHTKNSPFDVPPPKDSPRTPRADHPFSSTFIFLGPYIHFTTTTQVF